MNAIVFLNLNTPIPPLITAQKLNQINVNLKIDSSENYENWNFTAESGMPNCFLHQIDQFLLYLNLSITKKTINDKNNEKKDRYLSQNSNLRASNKNEKKITIFKYAFVIFVTCRYYIDIVCAYYFL